MPGLSERGRRRRGRVRLGRTAGTRSPCRWTSASRWSSGTVYNSGRPRLHHDRLRRSRTPSPAPTRTPTWTPTTRSPSGPWTPACEAPADADVPAGTVAGSGVKLSLSTFIDGKTDEGLDLPLQAQRQPEPGRRQAVRELRLQPALGQLQDDLQAPGRPEPRELDGHHAVLHGPLLGPLAQRPAEDHHARLLAAWTSSTAPRRSSLPATAGARENTFNDAEGAFIANKSGPVRAIRSYIGANSGPLTQREHIFYERRQDIRTFLRVHAIPGIMDYFDYAPAASGMTYKNNANTGGVDDRRRARHAVTPGRSPGRAWTATRAASRSSTRPDRHRRLHEQLLLLRRQHAGRRGRDPVHGRLDRLRQQRALDHAEHPQHRSAHRRLQEPAGHAHPLLRGRRARPTALRAARRLASPIERQRRPASRRRAPVRPRRWRAPRRQPAGHA